MAIRKPIFIRPLDLGTVASGNEQDGHPAEHLGLHDAIGLTWKSNGNSTVWARGHLNAMESIDFMSVVGANAVAGTKVRLRLGETQAEVDGTAPYNSGVLDFISPTPSPAPASGLYHSHLELPVPQTASWWRIDITGHTGDFEAAMLVLGKKIEPSRFYNWDYEYGVQDLGEGKFTPWGVYDETPGLILRTLDMTLGWVNHAEFEESFRPLIEQIGTRGVVYLCFDPEPTASRQSKTYMGMLKKPGFARGTRRPGFTMDFSLISMI